VLSDQQRAACRRDAERASSTEEALELKAACLAAAIQADRQSPPPTSAPPQVQAPAPALAGIDRYSYCREHQKDVQSAVARLTNASKPWILAPKRYSPDSQEYLSAQREYQAAVAELERLLPAEIRNGMDLLPTAARAFSRCDREELERVSGPG
jgi:hypothetical protein